MYMSTCHHCSSDKNINNYTFKWIDPDKKEKLFPCLYVLTAVPMLAFHTTCTAFLIHLPKKRQSP